MGAFRDMTGLRLKTITVLKRSSQQKTGRTAWVCVCDRGHEQVIVERNLSRRSSYSVFCKSCDDEGFKACAVCNKIQEKTNFYGNHGCCKPCDIAKVKQRMKTDSKTAIRRAISGAKYRSSVVSDIDEEFLERLASVTHCELTGWPLVLGDNFYKPSIDQIEAGKGYTKNNVRVICWGVNHMLGPYGQKRLLEIANAINRNQYEG